MKNLSSRKWLVPVILILLIAIGATAYYRFGYRPKQLSKTPTIQTTVVRRGDLVIYASGTGTLMPAQEYDLDFSTNGVVTSVLVKPGDQVQAGQLLAQVDDREARINFQQAKLKYQELTSDAAIAAALQSIADGEKKLLAAQLQLEYLLSPDVVYWQSEVEKTQQRIQSAQQKLAESPSDAQAKQELKDAQAYLDLVESKLADAVTYYKKVYVYKYFVAHSRKGDYLALPTKLEVDTARADILQAQTDIQDAKNLYAALTGQPVPADATSPELVALKQAKSDLDAAKSALDGTRIVAPGDGVITSVNISAGNPASSSPAIVEADLSQMYLQIYMDASDWGSIVVGKEAQVTFDALPGQTFTGKVTEVDAQLYSSGNTSTVRGMVLLDEPYSAINLPLGIQANVDVIGSQARNALLIPIEALHEISPGNYAVYVLTDGQTEQRAVKVGLQDAVSAQINSGLQPDELVVVGSTASQ